jgi:biotin transporter BioY
MIDWVEHRLESKMQVINGKVTDKNNLLSLQDLPSVRRVLLLLTVLIFSGCVRLESGGVPWTMQTLGVLLVAWLAKPQEGKVALAVYGMCIGGLTPWFMGYGLFPGATCGYWVGFMLAAAYVQSVGYTQSHWAVFWHSCMAQVLILCSGWLWLSTGLGFQIAFQVGVLPFFWTDLVKVSIVAVTVRALRKI